ncbi:MAG: dihydrolipoamide acetyltransferase family protein [Fimbriimonadaceae bacterium]
MPKMGDGMEEGTLVEWVKNEGDKVKSGEVIGSIQTDKATVELEAPGTGFLKGFLIEAGQTVPVGVPIAAILREGEELPASWGESNNGEASSEPTEEESSAKEEVEQVEPTAEAETAEAPDSGDRKKSSPLARKLAKEANLDLASIQGTGPGGRVVRKDVEDAIARGASIAKAIRHPKASKKVELNQIRKITAQRTQASKQEVPHFYVTVEVNCEPIESLRGSIPVDGGKRVTLNDLIIKACAVALTEMPDVNAEYHGDHVVHHGEVNIGMAVALEDALTLPVLHGADRMSVFEIGENARALVKQAKDDKLPPSVLQGATFAISNMGMLNVDEFSAIIVQPNAAILAVGTAKKRPVVDEHGHIVARTTMNITASFDHRVVDGAVGARFVNLIKDLLENPIRLFL